VGKFQNRIVGHEEVAPDQLLAHPDNFRIHSATQQELTRKAMAEVGWVDDVTVNRTTGRVIDGHMRIALALRQNEPTVPVKYVELTEAEERFVLRTFDPLGELATPDLDKLRQLHDDALGDGKALDVLDDLMDLSGISLAEGKAGLTDPDAIPDPPPEPTTKPGDLWLLGDHRLLCGDSTDPANLERAMNGESAALIIADPPYFEKVDADWDKDFEAEAGKKFEAFLDLIQEAVAATTAHMLQRGTSAWFCAPDFAWHIEGILRKHLAPINHVVWFKGAGVGKAVAVESLRRWYPRSERLLVCEYLHSPDALLASFNQKTAHIAARSAYAEIIDQMVEWQRAAGVTGRAIDEALGTKGMAGHYFGRSQWQLPTPEAWEIIAALFAERGVLIGNWEDMRARVDAQRHEFDAQRHEFDAQRREFDAQRREFDDDKDRELFANVTDVWQTSAPLGNERPDHPTPKPVRMIEKLVLAHSRSGDIVLDPFVGSGTTLLACEKTGRSARAIDREPKYCDLAVRRWEEYTGQTAVRVEAGLAQ
jgi:DNA modification methylase